MLETIITLIEIQIITVFIVDISGAVDSLLELLSFIMTKGRTKKAITSLRPLTCSLCMTFWLGILYLLISGQLTITYIGVISILAMLSLNAQEMLRMAIDILSKLNRVLYKTLHLDE